MSSMSPPADALTTATHPFDSAIQLDRVDEHTTIGQVHPEWAGMVGPFGGITSAVLINAIQTHPDRVGEPLALTVNFAAPIAEGEFEISIRPACTNRTNQHWVLEQRQGDRITTTATAVYAIRRETWTDTEAQPPNVPPPEQLVPSSAPGEFVVWPRLYDMRFSEGPFPDAHSLPSPTGTTTMWMRDLAHRPVDYPALAMMTDVFFPRIFLRCGGFVPAGTISTTSYFHTNQRELSEVGGDFVLGVARTSRFTNGHHDQSSQLWTRTGILLATSHQIVYFRGQ